MHAFDMPRSLSAFGHFLPPAQQVGLYSRILRYSALLPLPQAAILTFRSQIDGLAAHYYLCHCSFILSAPAASIGLIGSVSASTSPSGPTTGTKIEPAMPQQYRYDIGRLSQILA